MHHFKRVEFRLLMVTNW